MDQKDLDETLILYMKTKTYVSVNDKWFWQKMLYAMPKVPIDKLKAQRKLNDIDAENLDIEVECGQHGNQGHVNTSDSDDSDSDS